MAKTVDKKELTKMYPWVVSKLDRESVYDIMEQRNYVKDEMYDYLLDNNLVRFESGILNANDMLALEKLGMLDGTKFILDDRVIIPTRNAKGEIVAYTGWLKGSTAKYMTIASEDFSKEGLWFNIDRALDKAFSDKGSLWYAKVVVVEGLFDALSLDMLGVPAVATMGANVGGYKGEMLKLFDKVLCIPDTDKVGLKAVDRWSVGDNATFLYFKGNLQYGEEVLKYKDIDQLCNLMDGITIQQVLLEVLNLGVRSYTYELS